MQVPSLSRNQHRLQAPSTNRSLSGDFKLWMPDGAGLVRVPRRAPPGLSLLPSSPRHQPRPVRPGCLQAVMGTLGAQTPPRSLSSPSSFPHTPGLTQVLGHSDSQSVGLNA